MILNLQCKAWQFRFKKLSTVSKFFSREYNSLFGYYYICNNDNSFFACGSSTWPNLMKREKSGETRVLLFTLFGFFALLFCFCFLYLSKKKVFSNQNFLIFINFLSTLCCFLFFVLWRNRRGAEQQSRYFLLFFSAGIIKSTMCCFFFL